MNNFEVMKSLGLRICKSPGTYDRATGSRHQFVTYNDHLCGGVPS